MVTTHTHTPQAATPLLPGFKNESAFANKTAFLTWASSLSSQKNLSSIQFGSAKQAAAADAAALALSAKARAAAVLDAVKAGDLQAAKADIDAAVTGKAAATAARVEALTRAKGASLGLAAARVAEYKCIKTPQEYIEAFRARDIGRCVDPDLFGRLASNANATISQIAATSFNTRPANFFTGSDGLAKYLRYGPPPSVGNAWPQTGGPPGWPQDVASSNWAGLQQFSNGYALASGVGYSAGDVSVTDVFTITVVSRSAIAAALATSAPFANVSLITLAAGVSPTWNHLKDYFEVAWAEVGLTIPQAAIDVLASKSFPALTGCPSECAWHSNVFPSACAKRLVYTSTRTGPTTCAPLTQAQFNPSPSCTPDFQAGFQPVAPTSFDPASSFCGDPWKSALAYFANKGVPIASCGRNLTQAAILAGALNDALKTTSDPTTQALYVRAFMLAGCEGNFNPLFTGNGYTAAGIGGLLVGEATEFLFSPFLTSDLAPGAIATTQFCLGVNGGRLLEGTAFACSDVNNVTP